VSRGDDERANLKPIFEEYARSRDVGLRDQLVEAHLDVAAYLARRFANRGEPLDDLTQVASLAVVKAVERFDPARGLEFSTYLTPTVLGELKRHFRDKTWAVRAPRRLQELNATLGAATAELTQRSGRAPPLPELAAHVGASEEDVLEALEAGEAYRATSLDAPTGGNDDSGLGSRLSDDDEAFDTVEERAVLSPLLSTLPRRQQLIVHLRFFEGRTQSEISALLGISQMHVSRLLARSLAQLRQVGHESSEP
jgi:RNA polymerase sigma-B factor